VIRKRHAAEPASVHAGDSILPREPLIYESIVRVQQIVHAAVFADRARDEHLRFRNEPFQQAVVVGRVFCRVDDHFIHAAQVKPLRGEIVDQRVSGARIGQHPLHLFFEVLRLAELVVLGQGQQAIVGDAAP